MGVKERKGEYKSRVYTDRPAYADYDSAAKFQAIQAIIARRLTEHPHAYRLLRMPDKLQGGR